MTEETPTIETEQVSFWKRPVVRKVAVLVGAIAGVSIATFVLKNDTTDEDIENEPLIIEGEIVESSDSQD